MGKDWQAGQNCPSIRTLTKAAAAKEGKSKRRNYLGLYSSPFFNVYSGMKNILKADELVSIGKIGGTHGYKACWFCL